METLVNFILDNKDVITILVVIGTLIISSLSLYFTFKNNKTVHYINAITKSRIEWIQNLRETVADFISQTNIYLNVYYDDFDKSGEHLSKCKQLASKIALLLNCCDEKDKEIVDIVNQILVVNCKIKLNI